MKIDLLQKDIKQLDCGIRGATFNEVLEEYPLLRDVMLNFPDQPDDFYFDIKVHMLMPGQYPCIPNWHRDFVPRPFGTPDLSLIDTSKSLYLWVSGHPLTEFKDGRRVDPGTWVKFTQEDLHRGICSDEHIWRVFIRASDKSITPKHNVSMGKTRHSQVYLDANNFEW